MKEKQLKKQFLKAVLPSMMAFMFSGVYAIVDGFFVGRNVGDNGLAAVNLAYPIVALIQAIGTGIGMGGAIWISIAIGRGHEKEQHGFLKTTLYLLAAASFIVTAVLFLVREPLLRVFGAEGTTLLYAERYIRIIIYGAVFQILGTGIIPLIRNYDGSFAAMTSMISGFVTNVILDWLLVSVMQEGMEGAALATIIGQGVTLGVGILFMVRMKLLEPFKKGVFSAQKTGTILRVAISPFGLTMSPNLILLIINRAAATFGGNEAVACYAVVSYAICVVQLLLQGVGDGCQPLLSRCFGKGENGRVLLLRKYSYLTAILTSVICVTALFLLRSVIPVLFGASEGVAKDVETSLLYFLPGMFFVAFLRVTISYFYAVGHNSVAYLLIYGEPLTVLVLAVILPLLAGIPGVWLAVPLAQAIMAFAGILGCNKKRIIVK